MVSGCRPEVLKRLPSRLEGPDIAVVRGSCDAGDGLQLVEQVAPLARPGRVDQEIRPESRHNLALPRRVLAQPDVGR